MASGQRLVKTPTSRMEFSKESRPALTVPKTTWFFRTRFRIIRSVSTSMGPFLPGFVHGGSLSAFRVRAEGGKCGVQLLVVYYLRLRFVLRVGRGLQRRL